MSAQIDCPICMDCIETSKNCVTTECGHCFHASCLMTSVAHNGFGCPYCRTTMAEVPEEEDETVWSEEDDEENEDMFDDNALRGFRFFWNIQNGEDHDDDDDADEQQLEEWADRANVSVEVQHIPSSTFIAQKLQQQGVSYEELVKIILLQHDEYSDDEDFERIDGQTYGKVRVIVSNYTPEQASEPIPQPVQAHETVVQIEAPIIAEPKIASRRIMIHV